MDPRDNSRREPSTLVAELLDAAARCHAATTPTMREAVRCVVSPRAAAVLASGVRRAAWSTKPRADPRRFSFDARWHAAATEECGRRHACRCSRPRRWLPRRRRRSRSLSIDRLRRSLMRPHAVYLQEGLGLRLPEDEAAAGRTRTVRRARCAGAACVAHTRSSMPGCARVRPPRCARAARAPAGARAGRAGRGRPRDGGGGAGGRCRRSRSARSARASATAAQSRSIEQAAGPRLLRGMLDGVHRGGVLRVVLRPEGRHGGQAVRHGLDWLCASLLGLPLYEIARVDEKSDPALARAQPLSRDDASAACRRWSRCTRRRCVRRCRSCRRAASPISAACRTKAREAALEKAREEWRGSDRQRGDAGASATCWRCADAIRSSTTTAASASASRASRRRCSVRSRTTRRCAARTCMSDAVFDTPLRGAQPDRGQRGHRQDVCAGGAVRARGDRRPPAGAAGPRGHLHRRRDPGTARARAAAPAARGANSPCNGARATAPRAKATNPTPRCCGNCCTPR